MSRVTLEIGGHRYDLACRPGQEGHFLGLAHVIDRKIADTAQTMGKLDATRQLLFAALLLADELGELKAGQADPALAERLERIAERLERL